MHYFQNGKKKIDKKNELRIKLDIRHGVSEKLAI